MQNVTVENAKANLSQLISAAINGEEIIIEEDEKAVKLVPLTPEKSRPRFGSAKGKIEIADDFDAPLEDFDDYM